jgi:hypothetical protein
MSEETKNVIPHHYGERLRVLLAQPSIKPGDLTRILRRRGQYFPGKSGKDILIPHMTLGLLTSDEIELLIDLSIDREESLKSRIYKIPVEGKVDLPSLFQDPFSAKELQPERSSNYRVVNVDNFRPVNENKDRMVGGAKVVRKDLSKDWTQAERTFESKVGITSEPNLITLTVEHSSSETEKVVRKYRKLIRLRLKKADHKPKSEKKLKFGDFDNGQRVAFFLRFSGLCENEGNFKKITDIGLRPDDNLKVGFKAELRWMRNKVSELKINGRAVHEIEFLTDKSYHPSILVTRMEAIFDFDSKIGAGSFKGVFEFSDVSRKGGDAEFQTSVIDVKFSKNTQMGPISAVVDAAKKRFDQCRTEALLEILSA